MHAHENCLQSCQRTVVAAENVVQSELQSIQNKLEVCVCVCVHAYTQASEVRAAGDDVEGVQVGGREIVSERRSITLTVYLQTHVYLYVRLSHLYSQRCLAACQDDARDAIPPGVTDANDARVAKAQSALDTCVLTCADRVAALVPKTKQRILDALKEVQRQH